MFFSKEMCNSIKPLDIDRFRQCQNLLSLKSLNSPLGGGRSGGGGGYGGRSGGGNDGGSSIFVGSGYNSS